MVAFPPLLPSLLFSLPYPPNSSLAVGGWMDVCVCVSVSGGGGSGSGADRGGG